MDAHVNNFINPLAYPEFGKGGAQQLHADRANVKFDKVDILPE